MFTHSLTFALKGRAEILLRNFLLIQKQQKWCDVTFENVTKSRTTFSSFDLFFCGKAAFGDMPCGKALPPENSHWGPEPLQPAALWLSYFLAGSFRLTALPHQQLTAMWDLEQNQPTKILLNSNFLKIMR